MPRNLSSWINTFLDWSDCIDSPSIFRQWSAIGAVSAALQRRVWVETRTGPIYPNEFILLVASPGIGKSLAIESAEALLVKTSDQINILPTTVASKEQLYNEMQNKAIKKVIGNRFETMCAAVAMPDELGIFIRYKDFDFMQDLIKFYDCKRLFTYRLKHGDGNRLENVALTILGGTQPDTIKKILPLEAFGMGFAARFILVYSNSRVRQPVFSGLAKDPAVEALLVQDLQRIAELEGKYVFTKEAVRVIEDWHERGMPPIPSDRRLESYVQRRLLHLLKLCICIAASRRDELLIDESDVEIAREIMLTTEPGMASAFSAMGEGSSIAQIENIYAFVEMEFKRTGKGVPEYKVRDMLLREIPIYAVRSTLAEMQNAKWLRFGPGEEGRRQVYPARENVRTGSTENVPTITTEFTIEEA